MDEGTLKTPIPYCRLYSSFLLRVVKQFCRFGIWSETECKTPAEYGPQFISTPPIGKGRRGKEVREKVQ